MKLASLALLLVVFSVAFAERSLKEMEEQANYCCHSECAAPVLDTLRASITEFEAKGMHNSLSQAEEYTYAFIGKVAAGGHSCRANEHKRAGANGLIISCTPAAVDVSAAAQTVTCGYTANFTANYTVYYVYIYAYGPGSSSSPYVYSYPNPSGPVVSGSAALVIPRYASNGTWTIYGYAYDTTYQQYANAYTSVLVKTTVNDNENPKITSIVVPVFTLNPYPSGNFVQLGLTDDLSGLQYAYVYVYNSAGNFVYSMYSYIQASPPVLSATVVSVPSYTYTTLTPGTYSMQISIADNVGHYSYFYSGTVISPNLTVPYITVASSSCQAGYYLPYGAVGPCLPCPSQTYSNNGSFACQACPPGTISAGPQAKACTPCPFGYYSTGGSTTCSDCSLCPAGTYGSQTGLAVCLPCYPGSYSAAGATQCTGCPAGTSSCSGAKSCTACAAGTYSYGSYCQTCAPGTYAKLAGASQCSVCPANTYAAAAGATACTACAAGKTGPAGSTSVLNCV